MALSDTAIRAAKPGSSPIKLFDANGLFLLLQPSGGKLWRLKYRYAGKEKKLSIGRYPDVSLKEARRRRDEAREMLANGLNPEEQKRITKEAQAHNAAMTFAVVGEEYLTKAGREGREAVTIAKSRWLMSLMTTDLGERPIAEIKAPELLAVLKKVEAKGHLETARRMRSLAGRIFRHAIATARTEHDPSSQLRGALIAPKVVHHSALFDEDSVGALLRAIEGYNGQPLTSLALKLTPHVFVRPGELRRAEWSEFDLQGALWTIPATKMKMREPHLVPLSTQSIALLKAAKALSADQRYVFSSLYPGNRPMSENTINAALRRLGYTSSEMTAHGFRATASSLLNESGKWSPDAIERALAHRDSNSVRGTYGHEAACAILSLAIDEFWIDTVYSRTAPGNKASRALMTKLGLERSPKLDYVPVKESAKLLVYSISRKKWEARSNTGGAMKKPKKVSNYSVIDTFTDDGGSITTVEWKTEEEAANFAAEFESEERIERAREEASRLGNGEPGGGLSEITSCNDRT